MAKQKQVRPETIEAAEYVCVLTTLHKTDFPVHQILELYRCRWQIELAFKRLKSPMQFGHVQKYHDASSRVWIQAKLLTVLLIERLQQEALAFFPHGASHLPNRDIGFCFPILDAQMPRT